MLDTKTKPRAKSKAKRKPAQTPKVEKPEPLREELAAFALWWSDVYGRLEQLTHTVYRLRVAVGQDEPTIVNLFGSSDLNELYIRLADTAGQWGACSPSLTPPDLPPVVDRILG